MAQEIWDAYDIYGVKTGDLLVRGEPIPPGLFHIVCEVIVRHKNGKYLIMHRDPAKPLHPDKWELTAGGSAFSGEDALTCMERELMEETGVHADPCEFRQVYHEVIDRPGNGCIFYEYYYETDCDPTSVTLQAGETVGYDWVSFPELLEMIGEDRFVPHQAIRLMRYLDSPYYQGRVLNIWHTNDIHSYYERFARIVGALRKNAIPANDLVLDAGDFADTRSIAVSGTRGSGAMRLLAAAGYDAIAIGNNEYFAGVSDLEYMGGESSVPLLSCNLAKLDGSAVEHVLPSVILTKRGMRILVIGVSPWYEGPGNVTDFTDMSGIRLWNPVSTIREILAEEKGNYDVSVLLSHAGVEADGRIAEEIGAAGGLDVIIGGHSHTLIDHALLINGTWIHQSGKYGDFLGRISLLFDANGRIVFGLSANQEALPGIFPEDPVVRDVLVKETERGRATLAKPLYRIPKVLDYDPYRECGAMNFLADALRKEYGGDLALIHHGVLSGPVPEEISKMALLALSPSILNPTTLTWTGRQIREAIRASLQDDFIHQDGRGPGFRGTVLGALAVSANVQVSLHEDGALSIRVDEKELDDDTVYEVITDDYLFRGTGYEMLRGSVGREHYHPGYIRDLLERTLPDEELQKLAERQRICRPAGK